MLVLLWSLVVGAWCFMSKGTICEGKLAFGRALQFLQFFKRRSAHAAKTAIVGVKAGVGVAGSLTLAKRGAAHIGARLPGTAAHDAFHVLAGTGRPARIDGRAFFVVGRAVNVLAPFRHVAVQVEDAPAIRFLLSDNMSPVSCIV